MSEEIVRKNNCYHLIAVATNEKNIDIPIEFKDVKIEAKPKRGRKPKAKNALIRNNE